MAHGCIEKLSTELRLARLLTKPMLAKLMLVNLCQQLAASEFTEPAGSVSQRVYCDRQH
jgi:hypothetical protein